MKLHMSIALASALLLLVPARADAQGDQQSAPVAGHALMQRANESEQATTDMSLDDTSGTPAQAVQAGRNASYGGVTAGRVQAGGGDQQQCSTGPQCRVYFGQ